MKHHKAKRRARVIGQAAVLKCIGAVAQLRIARDWLRAAGAKNAADYVARALKSAEGAKRHAERIAREDWA